MTIHLVFLLHEHSFKSHRCLENYQVEVPDKEPIKHLEQTALAHIQSHANLQQLKSIEVAKLRIYLCPELSGRMLEKRKQVVDAANRTRGDLVLEDFSLLLECDTSEETAGRDIVIISKTIIRFSFTMFEQTCRSSYDGFGSGSVTAFPEDSAQTIYDAARALITRGLSSDGNAVTVTNLCLRELKGQTKEDHEKMLRTGLEPGLLRRALATIHDPEEKLGNIGTAGLVFTFTARIIAALRIPYVLFNSESGFHRFAGRNYVEASSEDTVGLLLETIRTHIKSIPLYSGETGYDVSVYEPSKAFELAYDKQPGELENLKLEEESFSGVNCSVLLPRNKLSTWRVGQTLVVVFGIPVQPQASSASISMVDRLLRLPITDEAPSVTAKLENYIKSQNDPNKRILDDRPEKDDLIAPIPLLYQPFGYFHDIRCGVKVIGEEDIRDDELREKVDALTAAMTLFHKSEEERSSKFIQHLEGIFGVSSGSMYPAKIPGSQKISDGHVNGEHGAMIFCIECKNELSTASCEPAVQLVSYIATSFKSQAEGRRELFNRWRVPALGVIHVGPNVQFYGVICMGQMRAVPLTPLLPMVDPTGEGFRWDLLLAFKAAAIIFSKIRTNVYELVQVLKDPEADWPPVMTAAVDRFPSITEIDAESGTLPEPQPEKIQFVLESRHDQLEHRHLYLARLLSPTLSDRSIYIKFSQRYSVELHRFCFSQGLAPKLLGFQRLSGGWFAVAMEMIDTRFGQKKAESAREAEEWREEIRGLVGKFHDQGLVHGDLRLANFVITKDEDRRRIFLIDFDWGGKEGEVVFPHEQLIEELGIQNHRLRDRKITKEHDWGCLERVLEALRFTPS